jgi:hypothetical protein
MQYPTPKYSYLFTNLHGVISMVRVIFGFYFHGKFAWTALNMGKNSSSKLLGRTPIPKASSSRDSII